MIVLKRKLKIIISIISVITIISISVVAYDKQIKSKIQTYENQIETLIEAKDKTHQLANWYRDNLSNEESKLLVEKLSQNWKDIDLIQQASQNQLNVLYEKYNLINNAYLGEFKLTAYCSCKKCCGNYGKTTSTGAIPKEGVTIAVDPRVIPYGTKVYIENVGYRIAQDCGGAIKSKKIDVYVNNHNDCYNKNYNQSAAKVWVVYD